jgi:molybdopterin synthase sulfur carrier subunit
MAYVSFTRHLLRFFPTLTEGQVPGATVREVIEALDQRYPGLARYIVDETGCLRRHVNLFVGDEPICDRETLADRVAPEDRVFILQSLSGG